MNLGSSLRPFHWKFSFGHLLIQREQTSTYCSKTFPNARICAPKSPDIIASPIAPVRLLRRIPHLDSVNTLAFPHVATILRWFINRGVFLERQVLKARYLFLFLLPRRTWKAILQRGLLRYIASYSASPGNGFKKQKRNQERRQNQQDQDQD